MSDSSKIFARNLTRLTAQAGWNKSELGEKLEVTHVQAGRYLKGESTPPFEMLNKMASIFGVTIDEFYKEDGHAEIKLASTTPHEALKIIGNALEELNVLKKKKETSDLIPPDILELLGQMSEKRRAEMWRQMKIKLQAALNIDEEIVQKDEKNRSSG